MWSLHDKTCVVTGASSGIGRETTLGLARAGARLVLLCRDADRAAAAARAAHAKGSPDVKVVLADLSEMCEVRRAAEDTLEQTDRIHVLVNNVGAVMRSRQVTSEGHEKTLALNHLGPFLLTNLLLDRIVASRPARIVVVASQVEARGSIRFDDLNLERDYQPLTAYDQSKLANVMFTYELARRLPPEDVTVNCLHPGVIATNLLCDYMGRPRVMSKLHRIKYPGAATGARTSIRLASDPALAGVSGRYFRPEGEATSSVQSRNASDAARLWAASEQLVGLA